MALGLTQPLTEMNTRNSHLRVSIVLKSGSLNLLEPSGPVQACGIALPLLNPLGTKLYLSFLKTQSVPRSKHPLLRLYKPIS